MSAFGRRTDAKSLASCWETAAERSPTTWQHMVDARSEEQPHSVLPTLAVPSMSTLHVDDLGRTLPDLWDEANLFWFSISRAPY